MKPAISVIIPVYKCEKYLSACIDSVLNQTFQDFEVILVNDGTKDRSIELLEELIERKYSALSSRIKIVHKENGGLPAARRTGLDHATGDYIYHVDSDDWLSEGSIAKIAEKIAQTAIEHAERQATDASAERSACQALGCVRLFNFHTVSPFRVASATSL